MVIYTCTWFLYYCFSRCISICGPPLWHMSVCGCGWLWVVVGGWVVRRPFRNYFHLAIPADECVRVSVHYFRNFHSPAHEEPLGIFNFPHRSLRWYGVPRAYMYTSQTPRPRKIQKFSVSHLHRGNYEETQMELGTS